MLKTTSKKSLKHNPGNISLVRHRQRGVLLEPFCYSEGRLANWRLKGQLLLDSAGVGGIFSDSYSGVCRPEAANGKLSPVIAVGWVGVSLSECRGQMECCRKEHYDWRRHICRPCELKCAAFLGAGREGWWRGNSWEMERRRAFRGRQRLRRLAEEGRRDALLTATTNNGRDGQGRRSCSPNPIAIIVSERFLYQADKSINSGNSSTGGGTAV
ncbi:hypothetical protein J6590_033900 [Homalodisca vitripennis]|nr:hypothetical protein J6590_033900 [Homalodisca vitripennis]